MAPYRLPTGLIRLFLGSIRSARENAHQLEHQTIRSSSGASTLHQFRPTIEKEVVTILRLRERRNNKNRTTLRLRDSQGSVRSSGPRPLKRRKPKFSAAHAVQPPASKTRPVRFQAGMGAANKQEQGKRPARHTLTHASSGMVRRQRHSLILQGGVLLLTGDVQGTFRRSRGRGPAQLRRGFKKMNLTKGAAIYFSYLLAAGLRYLPTARCEQTS